MRHDTLTQSDVTENTLCTATNHTTKPNVFGPRYWWVLHTSAANFEDTPIDAAREACKKFVSGVPTMLPCSTCGQHLEHEIAKRDIHKACSSGENLSVFWCDVHNSVNSRLGKPLYDCSQVRSQYL